MARAYASIILKAPVETVWSMVRDFNSLPKWAPAIAKSKIEGGLDPDVVGCVRSFHTHDGGHIRERLLMLDDARRCFTYNFEKPAFPVKNYIATLRLYPVTHTDQTFAEWDATFDEAPGDEGKYEKIVSKEVFTGNLKSLAAIIAKTKPKKPDGAERWKGGQPNKVWTSRVVKAPVADVWAVMRDFAGMGGWHDEITKMHMLKKVRSDKVGGIRDFYFGAGHLNEELLHLCDITRSFSYRITKCSMPWINYVSGPRLWPVTVDNTTFGVWTGDWDASPQDDLALMPGTEQNVYQRAFATLEKRLAAKKTGKIDMTGWTKRFGLEGKTALVTGATKGIGFETVKVLADAGANIAAVGRDAEGLNAVAKAVKAAGRLCVPISADMGTPEGPVKAAQEALAAFGTIDILVNNAGVALNDLLLEATVADWDATMAINLRAPFLLARALVPAMIARGHGKIINVSSQAGIAGLEAHGAYCASKGGLNMLTKVMTVEWAKHNIQINTVCPTVILTPMGEKVWGQPERGDPMRAKIPANRFGQPIEVADAILYLASSASNMVCGHDLLVDGGYTAV